MSTPVSGTPPRERQLQHHRVPTDQLTATMQRMIELQKEQQEQYYADYHQPTLTMMTTTTTTTGTMQSQSQCNNDGSSIVLPKVPFTPYPTIRNINSSSQYKAPSLSALTFVDPKSQQAATTQTASNQAATTQTVLAAATNNVNVPSFDVTNDKDDDVMVVGMGTMTFEAEFDARPPKKYDEQYDDDSEHYQHLYFSTTFPFAPAASRSTSSNTNLKPLAARLPPLSPPPPPPYMHQHSTNQHQHQHQQEQEQQSHTQQSPLRTLTTPQPTQSSSAFSMSAATTTSQTSKSAPSNNAIGLEQTPKTSGTGLAKSRPQSHLASYGATSSKDENNNRFYAVGGHQQQQYQQPYQAAFAHNDSIARELRSVAIAVDLSPPSVPPLSPPRAGAGSRDPRQQQQQQPKQHYPDYYGTGGGGSAISSDLFPDDLTDDDDNSHGNMKHFQQQRGVRQQNLQNHPPDRQSRQRGRFFFCCLSSCFHSLIVWATEFYYAESLHRSFCYGAVDGMLTGCGIVATFCGLQLFSTTSSHDPADTAKSASSSSATVDTAALLQASRVLVLAVSFCACLSDAVCMALGHVWTTHAVASAQSRDRQAARHHVLTGVRIAKGQLVDLLLQRGMLKIDAMSLADTLEGYPDLFVSALLGESLVPRYSPVPAASISGAGASGSEYLLGHPHVMAMNQNNPMNNNTSGASTPTSHNMIPSDYLQQQLQPVLMNNNDNIPVIDNNLNNNNNIVSSLNRASFSYGRLSPNFEDDPDALHVSYAVDESKSESIFMLLGFAMFGIVPALLFQVAVFIVEQTTAATASPSDATMNRVSATEFEGTNIRSDFVVSSSSSSTGMYVHPNTLAASFCAFIMAFLGLWKSHFLLDQQPPFAAATAATTTTSANQHHQPWAAPYPMNALVMVETVVVLLVCIVVAYGAGWCVRYSGLLPPLTLTWLT